MKLILGDCLEKLKDLPENSVDSIVTDPPYGLSFMGKKWDYDVPSEEIWKECLRVLKPGGYLLAFAGTRTQHRMAVRIEDAGFEIRDMIAWVYGSGFPKSLNIGKAIDKINGEVGRLYKFTEFMRSTGLTAKQINDATGTFMGSHYLTDKSQPAIPTCALWKKLRPMCGDVPVWVDELVDRIEAEREVIGKKEKQMSGWNMDGSTKFVDRDITIPSTEQAKQWEGWGTALKPALEPITVARKPLSEKTVAENCLKWGVGGINIDGCRVEAQGEIMSRPFNDINEENVWNSDNSGYKKRGNPNNISDQLGRFPANLIHDGSPEVLSLFPETKSGKPQGVRNTEGGYGKKYGSIPVTGFGDEGSAARFFYCAKASKKDRDGSTHPTMKHTTLMRYLCRLVTPKGGTVLDPFMGSGSTGKAAKLEGFDFIGIEREEEYVKIAEARINAVNTLL